jgi:antitoxin component of RelBE/YafQ-DinJ toxin-antitoxin module
MVRDKMSFFLMDNNYQKNKLMNFRIDQELFSIIQEVAIERDLTLSDTIRLGLKKGLKK